MSIPLIQEATKDAINTSIIAIKRNIERINMLLGLVDNDSPDLSGFATKQELQDAVTELQPVDEVTVGNMQSVTSNAVALMRNNLLSIINGKCVGETIVGTNVAGWSNYRNLGTLEAGKYAVIWFQTGFDALAIQSATVSYIVSGNTNYVGVFTVAEGGSGSNVNIAGYSSVARACTVNVVLLRVR